MARGTTVLIALWLAIGGVVTVAAPVGPAVDFRRDVQPIFADRCLSCHGEQKQKGGLRLDIATEAMKGGDDGVVIVPHHAAASLLLRYVSGADVDHRMPPKGDPLTPAQVSTLRAWIEQGAGWSNDALVAVADKRDHWAYRPIARPPVPSVRQADWPRTPIDAFVLEQLEARQLSPAPPADRRTLLRRVTFDLTGLPPTPEEVDAFLADESPDAYEKVVDRLLASPRYGERWARRWMDLVHFAETHGNDQDRERPNAWPYRDYLIRSFNADKPFARFIEEQVAGDALFPDDPDGVVALGFIAAGPWDESSQMAIIEDTVDKQVARTLDRDDMVATAMATFTSTTVGCARCHNHKFDPITQADYYGLQAVFAGVDRADRPYDADPKIFSRRHALARQKQGLDSGHYDPLASPLDPKLRPEVIAWAAEQTARQQRWAVLHPDSMRSINGSTLTIQPDDSIRSAGARPDVDTYVITARVDLPAIRSIRLELLTDDDLPHRGPGRQDNGNLHVNEFHLAAAPAYDPAAQRELPLRAARADFDQQGWTIAMSIDRNPQSAWGVYPQVGTPHVGVYELADPVGYEGGTLLTVTIEQTHGGGHLIGRFRLAASADVPPPEIDSLPVAISTPPSRWSDAQYLQLATHYLRQRVQRQLDALPPPSQVYAATNDFPANGNFKPARTPRPVFVLKRGDVTQPLEEAHAGALDCVPNLPGRFALADPNDESARRAALARWIADPRNGLTWRSIVNRAWQYHFGRGIVSTPSDFGHMGALPTHPALLDWLATWFLEHHGSLKQLDRLIVTSSAYRQSTRHDPRYAEVDADDRYLWRMTRLRLDAESVRDAILQISGQLDPTMGGPSARQFLQKPGVHVTPVLDYTTFDPDSPAMRRLSVYRFLWRTLPDPFMDALDYPDGSQLTAARSTSVTALQALAMMHDRFVIRYSEHLAERLERERPDLPSRVARLYELCLSRAPTEPESSAVAAYAAKNGLANACRVVLNSSEFLFVN